MPAALTYLEQIRRWEQYGVAVTLQELNNKNAISTTKIHGVHKKCKGPIFAALSYTNPLYGGCLPCSTAGRADKRRSDPRAKIAECHGYAALLGGSCGVRSWVNSTTLIPWTCGKCKNTWESTYANTVSSKSWCPECGQERGRVKRLGSRPHLWKPKGHAGFRTFFCRLVASARDHGRTMFLSDDQVKNIITSNCYWCDAMPANVGIISRSTKSGSLSGAIKNSEFGPHIGIDRVQNDKGYEMNNVVPCCSTCNYEKKNQPLKDWLDRLVRTNRLTKRRALAIMAKFP